MGLEQQEEWSYYYTYLASGRWLSYRWSFEYVVGWIVCRTLPSHSESFSNLSCSHEERYRASPALAYCRWQEWWWEPRNKDRLVHASKSWLCMNFPLIECQWMGSWKYHVLGKAFIQVYMDAPYALSIKSLLGKTWYRITWKQMTVFNTYTLHPPSTHMHTHAHTHKI